MRKLLIVCALCVAAMPVWSLGDKALDALMDRLESGLSRKISVILTPDTIDRFTISVKDNRPHISANNRVSAAKGLNHYLKTVAGAQPAWDCMSVSLPDRLPLPDSTITRSTRQSLRYYLNYCTHSYSMPFWDAERWQREIDWMALHGINAALTITGTDAVWDATLRRLGYPGSRIDLFIAAPAYQAWWLMNNLEGEGAPMTQAQLSRQVELQKGIISAMRELDIEPVYPGYSGMVPHDAATTLGLSVADPGQWCGYNRPAFLLPTDTAFSHVAATYYAEQKRLFGAARYYSMDPFHEGGNTHGVDLGAAAKAIVKAMDEAAPGSVWLIQGWQENPRAEILDAIPANRLTVLDLHAETAPQWNARGHRNHPWAWCMLLNFGGNMGLHGKLDYVCEAFDRARHSDTPPVGIGLTMEGIENNPVMYELVCDMPWEMGKTDSRHWLRGYTRARYGGASAAIDSAWTLLAESVYGAEGTNRQQGTTESVFCARPSDSPVNASTWANAENYYDGRKVIQAAELFASACDLYAQNPHYIYDLVDFTRQAIAEAGRMEARSFGSAATSGDSAAYRASATRFLNLISLQDSLLSTLPHFSVQTWIESARAAAAEPSLADAMERDARTLITTWGSRNASEQGKLHDYAHREWAGLLREFYAPRWRRWFEARLSEWNNRQAPAIDFYLMEEPWTQAKSTLSAPTQNDAMEMAKHALRKIAPYKNASNLTEH